MLTHKQQVLVILHKFSLLTEIKQKAVRLRAEGTTLEAIAVELNAPLRTVQDWLLPSGRLRQELEEYTSFLATKQIEGTEDLHKVAQDDAKAAWARLKAIALSEDDSIPKHVTLAALESMLDRAGLKRVKRKKPTLRVING